MQAWNVLHGARWNTGRKKVAKNCRLGTIAQFCQAISSQLRHLSTIWKKKLLSSNMSSRCPHDMVIFGPLAAEIGPVVWGHPYEFQRVSRLGSVTARQWSSERQPNCGVEQRAPTMFCRATITLGIGPHSSYYYIIITVIASPVLLT